MYKKKGMCAGIIAPLIYFCTSLAQPPCVPCGQEIVNLPQPDYQSAPVIPFVNYLASYEQVIHGGSFHGFYFGFGYGFGDIDYELRIAGSTALGPDKASGNYINERVTLGYTFGCTRFYFGIEAGYNYRSLISSFTFDDPTASIDTTFFTANPAVFFTVTSTPCNVRLDLNSQNAVTLDFKPGFVVTPKLALYGRIGGEYTSHRWSRHVCFPTAVLSTGVPGVPGGVTAITATFGDTQTKDAAGLRLGAGIAYAIGCHVSFNLDYVHTTYHKSTITPNTAELANIFPTLLTDVVITRTVNDIDLGDLALKNTIQPKSNEVDFGVTITF